MKPRKKFVRSRKKQMSARRVAGLTAATGLLSAPLWGAGPALAAPPEEIVLDAGCLTPGDHTGLAAARAACDLEGESLGYVTAFLRPCNLHQDVWCAECEEGREWLCFGVPDESVGHHAKKKARKKAAKKKASKKKAARKKAASKRP